MSAEVAAALIAAASAIALGIWNATRVRQLERMKSEFAREEAAERAKLDYEYEARRRLYERFEPALFQLLELGEYALERIANLADARTWGKFLPAEEEPPKEAGRPRMIKPNYSAVSTVYGLYAPLVIVRSMSRELTLIDLSLEPRIELQYFLAAKIYGSFKDDYRLAAIAPVIPYDPLHPDWRTLRQQDPAQYWWQGLTMGRLEGILDLLTIPGDGNGPERLASFGEFERLWEESVEARDEWRCKNLAVASNALLGFRPDVRPVFWRVLIAQARLYQALRRTRMDGFTLPRKEEHWKAFLALDGAEQFEWTDKVPDAPKLSEVLEVTERYLMRVLSEARLLPYSGGSGRLD